MGRARQHKTHHQLTAPSFQPYLAKSANHMNPVTSPRGKAAALVGILVSLRPTRLREAPGATLHACRWKPRSRVTTEGDCGWPDGRERGGGGEEEERVAVKVGRWMHLDCVWPCVPSHAPRKQEDREGDVDPRVCFRACFPAGSARLLSLPRFKSSPPCKRSYSSRRPQ
jgi:hypothetical protein